MGVTQAAGLSLRWVRDHLSDGDGGQPAGARLRRADGSEAGAAPAGCEGLLFLPYLMGERAPHLDPEARGGWIGLTARHDPGRSDAGGAGGRQPTACATASRCSRDGRVPSRTCALPAAAPAASFGAGSWPTSSGSRWPCWRTPKGRPYGAALLAGTGAGVYPDVATACARTLREAGRIEPDPGRRDVYGAYYDVYRGLYPALKPSLGRLAALAGGDPA